MRASQAAAAFANMKADIAEMEAQEKVKDALKKEVQDKVREELVRGCGFAGVHVGARRGAPVGVPPTAARVV